MLSSILLRPATTEDERTIFEWRNDPYIVDRSSSQKSVSWDEHTAWFGQSIGNPTRAVFIVESAGRPIGLVRFDRDTDTDCSISVYLRKEFTGQGLGVRAIKEGCQSIARHWTVNNIVACVRTANEHGKSAFRKAGFRADSGHGCPPDHAKFMLDCSALS